MKRTNILLALLIFIVSGCSQHSHHPRIYITDEKKAQLKERIESTEWVGQSFEKIKEQIEPYVDRHQSDPEWIVSRLQMYWDSCYVRIYVKGHAFSHGSGRAPVPTVKFAGHRDGATDYLMPSLEDTRPYMDGQGMYLQNRKKPEQPWEWVHPSKTGRMIGPMNERILRMAAAAAFMHWYSGEDKYAVFAYDIFTTYIYGMHHRREPFALEDYADSHLMGLATFEVILDNMIPQLAVCYDFLYKYLKKRGADFEAITSVFKRWADQEILYGVPDNNWNIFQARFIAYIALALENDSQYPDRKGRQFYLNEIMNKTSIRQFALKEVMSEIYDQENGMWPESASYSMSVCNDMLDIISLIENAENNRLLDEFPIIRKAAMAALQYLLPNGRVTAFGDAKYSSLNPHIYEMLAAIYRKYGERENEQAVSAVINRLTADGAYNRAANTGLFPMIFYVDQPIASADNIKAYDSFQNSMFYAPNVSWLIQRNGLPNQYNSAITLTGAYGNHAHANGISMELFLKGLPLGPESSYGETYGTRDNQEYYARFPSHNTVCVDGISDYGMMRSNHPYELLASYPSPGENLTPTDVATCALVGFVEPRTNSRQERFAGIVRTMSDESFVFDIFRSARNDGADKMHDYFFHNAGHRAMLLDGSSQSQIAMSPADMLSSLGGYLKGYDYFSNERAVGYSSDFIARFYTDLKDSPGITLDLWMQGQQGRSLILAEAPKSNAFVSGSVPAELIGQPLPTLVVRQTGEAWRRPFAAIYSAREVDARPTIERVSYFGKGGGFVGISVHESQRTTHIFSAPSDTIVDHEGILFDGSEAIVCLSDGQPANIVLLKGNRIEAGGLSIQRIAAKASISVGRQSDCCIAICSTGDFRIEVPIPSGKAVQLIQPNKPDAKPENLAAEEGSIRLDLDAGRYELRIGE
ncbi:MAG: hypothetical protein LBD28_03175 [Tannerellaceae bacterium]|jgi:hypothetical protein|nr:hypothetical protein [Tannerellaceae bacterium]